MKLSGTVGIVTGASRGLGVVIAERLARAGVDLALAARSQDELEKVAGDVGRFGHRVIAVPTDVNKADDRIDLVQRTTEELGPPDLLVNNAGIERYGQFQTLDPQKDIADIITTNLISIEQLTRVVVPGMVDRRKGHIVNVASLAGKTGVPFNSVYSSTKHGLVGFTWSLREELRSYGVGVSVVCPTFVTDEGMFSRWSQGAKPPSAARPVTPEEVADAVVKAVEHNKPEILVTKGLGKIADVLYALSPDLALSVSRRMGVFRFVRKATEYDEFAR
jgi:short-subunit dehydrogenase